MLSSRRPASPSAGRHTTARMTSPPPARAIPRKTSHRRTSGPTGGPLAGGGAATGGRAGGDGGPSPPRPLRAVRAAPTVAPRLRTAYLGNVGRGTENAARGPPYTASHRRPPRRPHNTPPIPAATNAPPI